MMTNFTTIRLRIDRLRQLRAMEEGQYGDLLPKKEVIKLKLEIEKLEVHGRRGMQEEGCLAYPWLVPDPLQGKLGALRTQSWEFRSWLSWIPTAIPIEIDYVIPGNDDAIRAVKLISATGPAPLSEATKSQIGC